jgi:hypothetical protein
MTPHRSSRCDCSSRRFFLNCALPAPPSSASTSRSPGSAPNCPTTSSLGHCQALDRLSRRGSWSPSVSAASASRPPPRFRSTRALRPSPSAAATNPGSTGATRAPSSPSILHRVGRPNHPALLLGARLLQELSRTRHAPPGRAQSPRFQVDSHPPPMLGRAEALRRVALPACSLETPSAAPQVCCCRL